MKRLSLIFLLLLAACGDHKPPAWLGYGEGDYSLIGAPQPGWVTHLAVQRGQPVKRGDFLFSLDNTHETAVRDQAAANLAQAKAELAQEQANNAYTQTELKRQTGLANARAGVPSTFDSTLAAFRESQAHIDQLEGQIRQMEGALTDAQYQLSQRHIVSQVDGQVQDIYFFQGEYAPASTPVVSVLPPANVFVRFFVPESEFAHVKLGQNVAISCDGCAANLTAKITFIAQQEEFTPPVIFSLDSRQKLVFKLEARAPGGLKLNPGEPVEVRPLGT
ncbi:MAG: HlyD family efflux transporter periplasmic adaptor subunit [Rhizomicrobium sp.]|jgi:HlyD family secretion protein